MKLFCLTVSILLCFGCNFCFAADLKVWASVDKTEMALDEFVQFSINIEGAGESYNNPQLKFPQLEDNFSVVATSHSNSINLEGAKANITISMQYTLLPKKEGELKITPAQILYEGKTYETTEMVIKVSPPKNPIRKPQQEALPREVPWNTEEGIFI